MPFYYFNNDVDDHYRHEVHEENCSYIPNILNRTLIGLEPSCSAAIKRANNAYPTKEFDGCYWCCRECHKG